MPAEQILFKESEGRGCGKTATFRCRNIYDRLHCHMCLTSDGIERTRRIMAHRKKVCLAILAKSIFYRIHGDRDIHITTDGHKLLDKCELYGCETGESIKNKDCITEDFRFSCNTRKDIRNFLRSHISIRKIGLKGVVDNLYVVELAVEERCTLLFS